MEKDFQLFNQLWRPPRREEAFSALFARQIGFLAQVALLSPPTLKNSLFMKGQLNNSAQ